MTFELGASSSSFTESAPSAYIALDSPVSGQCHQNVTRGACVCAVALPWLFP